jgi:hypothetical protein
MARLLSTMSVAVFLVLLTSAPAGAADGTSVVRFVHAVPGVGDASLEVSGHAVGTAGFGEATDQVSVPAGDSTLDLTASGGVELSADESLRAGQSYLAVALTTKKGGELRVFRDRGAAAGLARLRIIHAAPELGDADIAIDGKVVAKGVAYTDATDYLQLQPGDYRVDVESPKNGDVALSDNVALASSTADTALLVGTQGEPAAIVVVEDDVAAPKGAPETGLGGLARRDAAPDWIAAMAAALAAGGFGLLLMRRRAAARTRRA